MSTQPTPIRRHGGLENVSRALAVLTALMLAGIVVLVLVDQSSNTSNSQVGTGSGVAATQARSLPPFTGVDVTGDNNVVVRVGARQSVIVHADSNLLGRVTTQVSSGSLVIENTPGTLNARSPMFVAVSVPSLDALTVRLSGSGTIHAAGTTARLDVAIDGSGTGTLSQLIARDAMASINGSGSIVLTATHSLDASISGSGSILYTGNPAQVTKSVSGSGTISGG